VPLFTNAAIRVGVADSKGHGIFATKAFEPNRAICSVPVICAGISEYELVSIKNSTSFAQKTEEQRRALLHLIIFAMSLKDRWTETQAPGVASTQSLLELSRSLPHEFVPAEQISSCLEGEVHEEWRDHFTLLRREFDTFFAAGGLPLPVSKSAHPSDEVTAPRQSKFWTASDVAEAYDRVNRFLGDALVAEDYHGRHTAYSDFTAILNHACIPNCYFVHWKRNATRSVSLVEATLVSLRPIEPGEELTISYSTIMPGSSTARRQSIQRQFGFQCMCTHCKTGINDMAYAQLGQHLMKLGEEQAYTSDFWRSAALLMSTLKLLSLDGEITKCAYGIMLRAAEVNYSPSLDMLKHRLISTSARRILSAKLFSSAHSRRGPHATLLTPM
jgi:hypothetical protein